MDEAVATGAARNRSRRPFAAFHRADRNFYLGFLLACWLGVIMGFLPAATGRLAGHAPYPAPLILQVHALAFSAWLLLLTIQIGLVRIRKVALHMTFGMVGIALIPVMAVSAYGSEIYSQQFHFDRPPNNLGFFVLPIFYVAVFAVLATLAVLARKNPSAHKRLILLATTMIVGAAYARWWGEGLAVTFGDGHAGMLLNTYAGTNLLLVAATAYDFVTRRRLHPVYEVAVPSILIAEVITSVIYHSPQWPPIAQAIIGR
jgi:hypothetical protein